MFHNIKGKKHGLKFVIKGKKVFLCDTNLNYVNVKIYRTTALAMRCMIFGGILAGILFLCPLNEPKWMHCG